MNNKFTIISRIITLLHISTLSCHPQGACNQIPYQVTHVFQMQLLLIQYTIKMFQRFYTSFHIIVVEILTL